MREIFYKYFKLPEENKGIISERIFFARLAVSVTCIVLCLSAMGFSAYAFFTASVSSNMNQIQAASYSLSAQASIVHEGIGGSVAVDSQNPNKYTLQKGMYDFTLSKSGNASTGYCKIRVNSEEVAVTSQIADRPITVRIEVAQETEVEFISCWGTYSSSERFDEANKMIVVEETSSVSVVAKSDEVTISANKPQSTDVTSEIPNTVSNDESSDVETEGDEAESTESEEDVTTSINTAE